MAQTNDLRRTSCKKAKNYLPDHEDYKGVREREKERADMEVRFGIEAHSIGIEPER